ncbi:uncharacterized protein BO66DRAFT_437153 [Aspergillus aculeatinus CBS 121060]|uniref:Uncharacterized protein n=1 Tax=Aspergillus aculeatinus CBS 121060 TaxID=1448322 RepID=A0ACD1HD57_9EURO|nr:hypothetical protein BO66DRAFT_437153 [Aspergillus aculeatinus CBS 121060]RAH71532.1 hypothetical protein BO66DRAFT_437153 [Aspergillus aculeatinus CBS 121060]
MAQSPRGNKQRAVAAAGSDEKAASSSFLAELDHALESRSVSWLQAVESLSQNPSTEPPGHGITKSIEQTTIHHNTDQKDNNTAGCDESNTAFDNDISGFESSGASTFFPYTTITPSLHAPLTSTFIHTQYDGSSSQTNGVRWTTYRQSRRCLSRQEISR